MSKIVVEVKRITDIKPHLGADRLEVACLGAWTTCIKKDVFKVGDLVVFLPPDAILPKSLHEFLGITKYCGEMPKNSEEHKQGRCRVRATRLRGERSFGTLMTLEDVVNYTSAFPANFCLKEGDDVADMLDITKYIPPEKIRSGDAAPENALFHTYTDIERYQNYPHVMCEGEHVVVLEKVHGCLKKGSLIELYDGTEKPIEDIIPGDVVKTYDVKAGLFTESTVIGIKKQNVSKKLDWFELAFDNGRTLICTADHPILTTEGWVCAEYLTEKHTIL